MSSSLWGVPGKEKLLQNGDTSFKRSECSPGMTGGQLVNLLAKISVEIDRLFPITKYVFSKKKAPDGSIELYKARKVVQGFNQVFGRDYRETFSLVIGYDTLRIILKLVVQLGWEMKTMDFTQAYLNAPLKEEIYVLNTDGTQCRLNKALYGLKQVGLEWNRTLRNHIMKKSPWKQSKYDDCLFFAHSDGPEKAFAVLAIYVDDIIMAGSWKETLQSMQSHLLDKFDGKLDEAPTRFLPLEITRKDQNIHLYQTAYCKSIIGMIYKTTTKAVHTPLECGTDLTSRKRSENELNLREYPYRQILGKLMYLSHMSRPDISNAVRELGQHMHDPCKRHWDGIKHLLKYLNTYPNLGLLIEQEHRTPSLKGYSDADFATDKETRRSCAGYMIMYGTTLVTWSSKIERCITLSTAEAEWTALVRGIRHGNYIRGVMIELDTPQPALPWRCDNLAAIKAAKTPGFSGRTRHVDAKLKFTRQECELGNVDIEYVCSSQQLADGLTKRLKRQKHRGMIEQTLCKID